MKGEHVWLAASLYTLLSTGLLCTGFLLQALTLRFRYPSSLAIKFSRGCAAHVASEVLAVHGKRLTRLLLCRDELQAKVKMLDHKLDTARTEQEAATKSCKVLEERLAREQSSIKQLQEQYDQAVQQRYISSAPWA